jgi:ferrous iron transport protein B
LTIKLLEKDEIGTELTDNQFEIIMNEHTKKIETHTGDEIDIVIADGRYGFIHGLSRDVVKRSNIVRKNISDAIDTVILNRFLGIPIFLAIMYFVFMLTINFGSAFIDFLISFWELYSWMV